MSRVLLLMPSTSYRASDFLAAARRLGVEVVVGSDHEQVLAAFSGGRVLRIDFHGLEQAVRDIVSHARRHRLDAVIGTDDESVLAAARSARALGLAHNPPGAVEAARDKYRFRTIVARAGLRSPAFALVSLEDDLARVAREATYPCVLKPRSLSGSRGVIRADDARGFTSACRRIAAILAHACGAGSEQAGTILVETFIGGPEVSLEGLLDGGRLQVLALFDKPDPLDGPFFEETMFVTPSRLAASEQRAIAAETARVAGALGLGHGPIHAELRIDAAGPCVIELAARTIGGLCSRALAFAGGRTLEELVLRQALGLPGADAPRESRAAGVMMIPIPAPGRLVAVGGVDAARAVAHVEDVLISVAVGDRVVPPPEADRYLGFIIARADSPRAVEAALRAAHARIELRIYA